jgi:hypothetical protein
MSAALRLLCCSLLFSLATSAQQVGTVTLVEGTLQLIRGDFVMRGVEGARVHSGDILESSNGAFAQVELSGGTIVALGPATRIFLFHYGSGEKGEKGGAAEIVILSGWLKSETNAKGEPRAYATPLLAATTADGTVVVHAGSNVAEIFVESGSANVAQVSHEGALEPGTSAKPGQFFSIREGKNLASASRPDSGFLQSMPVQFRDTLPPRSPRFVGKQVEPKRDHEVSYEEVRSWLTAPRKWRKGFVDRFRPRLSDPKFRRELDAHVKEHPEWDPVLHPENYPVSTQGKAETSADSREGRSK